MDTQAENAENKIRQYVVQIRVRNKPATASWIPSNKDQVDSFQFFIADQLPTGDYELLKLTSLSAANFTKSIVGLCGVTTEQNVQERKGEEQYIFQRVDRVLELAQSDVQSLILSIANERWLLKEVFTGPYDALLEAHFVKIRVVKIGAPHSWTIS